MKKRFGGSANHTYRLDQGDKDRSQAAPSKRRQAATRESGDILIPLLFHSFLSFVRYYDPSSISLCRRRRTSCCCSFCCIILSLSSYYRTRRPAFRPKGPVLCGAHDPQRMSTNLLHTYPGLPVVVASTSRGSHTPIISNDTPHSSSSPQPTIFTPHQPPTPNTKRTLSIWSAPEAPV